MAKPAILRLPDLRSPAQARTQSGESPQRPPADTPSRRLAVIGESRIRTAPGGVLVDLSGGEYELLLAFLRRPRIVLTRDQLLDITRRRGAGPFDRAIDVQVKRLRRKIEADPKRRRSSRPCAATAVLASAVERQ